MFKRILKISLVLMVLAAGKAHAYTEPGEGYYDPYDQYPWAVSIDYGRMTHSILNRVLRFNYELPLGRSKIYGVRGSYQLDRQFFLRRWLQPLVSTIELTGNVAYFDDPNGHIYQFNPYLFFRWRKFPWNEYLLTTIGIGEGMSWSSGIPQREIRDTKKALNARKFLNYLYFEITASIPKYPNWQLVYMVHHRSGVFGLYSPGITGSTAIGIGIRYLFR